MSIPIIQFLQLSKKFGRRDALLPLTLDIHEGEIFGLLGHNGAGKSTTLGAILGHIHPTSGDVLVLGQSAITNRSTALRHIGAIFENPAFYDYLSGYQNLKVLTAYSHPVPEQLLQETIELVGLTARIHDPVRFYSHGMRQRLALAQALLPRPRILILDEPTNGLDPIGIVKMRNLIQTLNQELKLTILLASHLLVEVEKLCDRVAILHQGKLLFQGQWQDVRPTDAEFQIQVSPLTVAQKVAEELGAKLHENRLTLPSASMAPQFVRECVTRQAEVHAFHPHPFTLEDFYLKHAAPPSTPES